MRVTTNFEESATLLCRMVASVGGKGQFGERSAAGSVIFQRILEKWFMLESVRMLALYRLDDGVQRTLVRSNAR
jgi:hypothetical protein